MNDEHPKRQKKRPRGKHIKVWVTPEEHVKIAELAKKVRLSHSGYLRAVGLNMSVKSVVDLDAIKELVKINGDLGRVAGLLKLWLAEKKGQGAKPSDVVKMMDDFRELQKKVFDLIGQVALDS